MSDTPMDVAYNAIVTDPEPANPSSRVNPAVGMRKPQYMTDYGRQVGGGIHDKRIVDIWTVKVDNEIIPTPTYQDSQTNVSCEYDGCGCDTCKEMNVCCDICPVCQANEMKNNCCSNVNKQSPCWDGYVQRGMKEQNGKKVPNCVPVSKADEQEDNSQESFFDFRDLKPTRNIIRVEE